MEYHSTLFWNNCQWIFSTIPGQSSGFFVPILPKTGELTIQSILQKTSHPRQARHLPGMTHKIHLNDRLVFVKTCCHCEPVRRLAWQSPRWMKPGSDYHQKCCVFCAVGRWSIHILSNWGIATPLKRTGSQWQIIGETARQTPICRIVASIE